MLLCDTWKYGAQTVLWRQKKGRKEKHKHAISSGSLPWHLTKQVSKPCMVILPRWADRHFFILLQHIFQSFFILITPLCTYFQICALLKGTKHVNWARKQQLSEWSEGEQHFHLKWNLKLSKLMSCVRRAVWGRRREWTVVGDKLNVVPKSLTLK